MFLSLMFVLEKFVGTKTVANGKSPVKAFGKLFLDIVVLVTGKL